MVDSNLKVKPPLLAFSFLSKASLANYLSSPTLLIPNFYKLFSKVLIPSYTSFSNSFFLLAFILSFLAF